MELPNAFELCSEWREILWSGAPVLTSFLELMSLHAFAQTNGTIVEPYKTPRFSIAAATPQQLPPLLAELIAPAYRDS